MGTKLEASGVVSSRVRSSLTALLRRRDEVESVQLVSCGEILNPFFFSFAESRFAKSFHFDSRFARDIRFVQTDFLRCLTCKRAEPRADTDARRNVAEASNGNSDFSFCTECFRDDLRLAGSEVAWTPECRSRNCHAEKYGVSTGETAVLRPGNASNIVLCAIRAQRPSLDFSAQPVTNYGHPALRLSLVRAAWCRTVGRAFRTSQKISGPSEEPIQHVDKLESWALDRATNT